MNAQMVLLTLTNGNPISINKSMIIKVIVCNENISSWVYFQTGNSMESVLVNETVESLTAKINN